MFGRTVAPTAASAGTVKMGLKLVVLPLLTAVPDAELAEGSGAADVRPRAPPDEMEVVSTSGLCAPAKELNDAV